MKLSAKPLFRVYLLLVVIPCVVLAYANRPAHAATGDLVQSYLNDAGSVNTFGERIVALGGKIAIGDRYGPVASTPNQYDGLVHIYDAATGTRERSIAGTLSGTQWYGASLARFGDNLLVGSEDGGGSVHNGYVELHDPAFGAPLRVFQGPSMPRLGTSAEYGTAVAAIGNRVIVGDPNAYFDSPGTVQGAVYVHDSATGDVLRTIANPAASDSFFGTQLVEYKGRLLVGGANRHSTRTEASAVRLYDLDTGALLRSFLNPTPPHQFTHEDFGESIAVSGDYIFVGTPNERTFGEVTGAVYVFDGETGNLLRTMHAPRRVAYENFGGSLAARGHHLLVSNSAWANGGNEAYGAALLYDARTGVLLHRFTDPTPATVNSMAWSVAFADNGDVLAASSDTPGPRLGVVYRFEGVPASLGGVAYTDFDEPAAGAANYVRDAIGAELGFGTSSMASGVNPFAGVANGSAPMSPKQLSHRSVRGTTTFDALDVMDWREIEVSLSVRVANTTYEAGDFVRVRITDGTASIDLLNLVATNNNDNLDALAGDGFIEYSALVPSDWQSLQLIVDTSTNSTAGSEQFDFDNLLITGVMVPEPSTIVLLLSAAIGLGFAARYAAGG